MSETASVKLEEGDQSEAVTTWTDLLPQVLALATAFLSADGDTSTLTREAVNLASKFLSMDLGSYDLTPDWVNLLAAGSSWALAYLTIPVLLAGILWYFVTTFILRKNVLGRSFRSSAKVKSQQDALNDLTRRVVEAVDHPR